MNLSQKVTEDIYFVGGSDRRLALFENAFPIENGITYNSYLLLDDKNVLFDTVDNAISEVFFDNITSVLAGKNLDYIVINHMEPDHSATLEQVVLRYPEVKIICNDKAKKMVGQFFGEDMTDRFVEVKEGSTFSTGKHNLRFIMMPMVHWPEAMATYDETDKILFSADAFGGFGGFDGNIFDDEIKEEYFAEARRYYTNIVGKFGASVLAVLAKCEGLDIKLICPLHGVIWRKNIGKILEKYAIWAAFKPEEKAVVIVYASIYGHTENACDLLAFNLVNKGVKNVKIYDVSKTDISVLVSEAFRASHLVVASVTYNGGIFGKMEAFLQDLKAHNFQNRTVAVLENGTWAASSARQIKEIFASCKALTVLEETVTIKSALKQEQMCQIDALAEKIKEDINL